MSEDHNDLFKLLPEHLRIVATTVIVLIMLLMIGIVLSKAEDTKQVRATTGQLNAFCDKHPLGKIVTHQVIAVCDGTKQESISLH